MPANKRARRHRKADEFPIQRLMRPTRPPIVPAAAYSWTLEQIMSARDSQMAGRFDAPVKLAASMRTDDALAVAYKNRLSPLRALSVVIEPGRGSRADAIAGEGEALFGQDGIALSRATVADINGDLANHGVAVGYNSWMMRDDASRVDLEHHCWPLEFVWWDAARRQLMTQLDGGGGLTPIVHGDGRWTVYQSHESQPWRQDAAVLPGALVWAAHAFAARDWSRGSASHGNAKVVGELAPGVPLQETDADTGVVSISDQAESFLDLLGDLSGLDMPFGIKPAGSTVDYLMNTSRAWEVWERLMSNREKAAARIYLGTDGTLGATGGAPGVDISELFGVATTIIQGDRATIDRGVREGVIEPWCAVNHGDSAQAPRRSYVLADPDEMRAREEHMRQEAAFVAAIQARREAGFEVTQDWADKLADRLGVDRGALAVAPDSPGGGEKKPRPAPSGQLSLPALRSVKT